MGNNTGNVTHLLEECLKREMSFRFIFGVTISVSVVFGILGNVSSVIVLVQPSMRSSTSILLVALAVYDTIFLTISLLPVANIINLIINNYQSPSIYKLSEAMVFSCLQDFALTGTIYATVMVTIERAVVVVFPLKAKLVCTKTRASVACGAVFVWSLIYNVPRFIFYYYWNYFNINTKRFHDYRTGYFYKYVFMIYLNTTFNFILPVGVIIILNIAIIQRLCTRGRGIIHQVSSRGDNQTQLTAMIIVLTGIFCASRIMYMAATYMHHREMSKQSESGNNANQKRLLLCLSQANILLHVTEFIVIVNSATNFIVYSIFGHKFRRCLPELCCSRNCLQAHRSPPETQAPSGNKLSTSASSLHPNILQDRQRSNSPSRTSALLAVPERDGYLSTASPGKTSALLAVPETGC